MVLETSVAFLRLRLRFGLLLSRMWLLYGFMRLILPVPVVLKRFAAARRVFNFGIIIVLLLLLVDSDDHSHVSAFNFRFFFYMGGVFQFISESNQQITAQFRMAHFAAAEHNRNFDFAAFP